MVKAGGIGVQWLYDYRAEVVHKSPQIAFAHGCIALVHGGGFIVNKGYQHLAFFVYKAILACFFYQAGAAHAVVYKVVVFGPFLAQAGQPACGRHN